MRIVAYTKYGVYYGTEKYYDEIHYFELGNILERVGSAKYFRLRTDYGEVYFTQAMIEDSLFILEK